MEGRYVPAPELTEEEIHIVFAVLMRLICKCGFVSVLESFKQYIKESSESASKYVSFGPATKEEREIFNRTTSKVSYVVENLEFFIDILKKQQNHE